MSQWRSFCKYFIILPCLHLKSLRNWQCVIFMGKMALFTSAYANLANSSNFHSNCRNNYRIYPKYSDTSTPYYICSKIWTSTIHYLMLCLKIAGWVANSVDPDETPCSAASHLGLYCLLRPVCLNTYGKYGSYTYKETNSNPYLKVITLYSQSEWLHFFCLEFKVGNVLWHHNICLTLKTPRKPASENVICLCRLLNILAKLFKPIFAYWQTVWTQIRLLLFLTLKMPRKPASENVVCLYRLLNILANFSNLFFAYRQTGAVWSGSTLFAKMTFKITSRWQSRQQLLWLAV